MVVYANIDFVLSGLTKKAVRTDRLLSTLLGVSEGDLVSYAEISKGLHRYIKENNLRNLPAKSQPTPQQEVHETNLPTSLQMKQCRDCGGEIPSEAVFCDLCGVSQ